MGSAAPQRHNARMKLTPAARYTLEQLPAFGAIELDTLVDQLRALLDQQRSRIDQLTARPEAADWDNCVLVMEAMADELHHLFSPVSHLHSVADNATLREVYNECVALVSGFASDIAQHAGLAACYRHIQAQPEFASRPAAERQLVLNALRDFRLGGVELPAAEREQVKSLRVELARLGTRFEENLLDATQAFRLNITDRSRLAGLPDGVLALAASNAAEDNDSGWTLTLDLPCYLPAMMRLDDRELRQTLYKHYATRASDQAPASGEHDNSPVMHDILERRQALARVLGFDHYADLSLATKMAPSSEAVTDFLLELATRARPAAEQEYAELCRFARDTLGLDQPQAWDLPWCTEKLREARFSFSQEDLKPYFPVQQVQQGLFSITTTLFGVSVVAVDGVETWHPDVEVFAILNHAEEPVGYFFLDLYARDGKRGGAWMDECLVRWRNAEATQLPVAYLTCNFTPPVAGQPTLLTHDEVTTLFHEFGHGLHHMLTQVDVRSVSGINGVAWDAVELPSQILENWCWEKEALDLIGAHHETGAPIPDDLFERLRSSKQFQAAMQTLRQVEFALFDFELHRDYTAGTDIQALLDSVRQRVAVVQPPALNRFQHAFAHIFAGGYAAGYYSYKWAEVLAADAFARFEEEGVFNSQTGQAFREAILEAGGSDDAMALFVRFRGREPEVDALLRQTGLLA